MLVVKCLASFTSCGFHRGRDLVVAFPFMELPWIFGSSMGAFWFMIA